MTKEIKCCLCDKIINGPVRYELLHPWHEKCFQQFDSLRLAAKFAQP